MKLSQLASKPQLVKMTIDDEEIVAEFGEPLEFYTWDRQPMDVFIKMAAVDSTNYATVIDSVRSLILDENGKQILDKDIMLPTHVLMKVVTNARNGRARCNMALHNSFGHGRQCVHRRIGYLAE